MKLYNWINLLCEININPNDNSIKNVGRGKWTFNMDDNNYIFMVSPINLENGRQGFMVEWGKFNKNGTISTNIEGTKTNVIRIFSKVISCMYMFLKKEDPEEFVMYANNKLAKIYDMMWLKFKAIDPFNKYFFRDSVKHKMIDGNYIHIYHHYKNMKNVINESYMVRLYSEKTIF